MIFYYNLFNNMNCFSMIGNAISNIYYGYSLNDKNIHTFHFIYGTTVHASDLNQAKSIMKFTHSNFAGNYWANQIDDELWEVQYCDADMPSLYVTVNAETGKDAAYSGYSSLEKDMNEMQLISN